MVSEFVVEATSGGTCVLRVVTSAFGTGADWEQEFFDDMVANWKPYFDNLRLYLTHFPGQQVTWLNVAAELPGPAPAVWASMRTGLGVDGVGQTVDAGGVVGQVERMSEPPAPHELMIRTTEPVPGFLVFTARGLDVVGWCWGYHLLRPDGASMVYIHELEVEEAHRRRGIGRRLVEAALGAGAELGATKAFLTTGAANTAARAVYDSLGGRPAVNGPTVSYWFALVPPTAAH